MATALVPNSETEPAEIEDIEETIKKAKEICKKLDNHTDEKSQKVKSVLKDIIGKLDIAMCDSIILEETQTSVPSLTEQNEVEIVVKKICESEACRQIRYCNH